MLTDLQFTRPRAEAICRCIHCGRFSAASHQYGLNLQALFSVPQMHHIILEAIDFLVKILLWSSELISSLYTVLRAIHLNSRGSS